MRTERRPVGVEAPEVDDAVHGCRGRRVGDGVRRREVGLLESAPLRHRVDEVVQHVDVRGCLGERRGIRRRPGDDLDLIAPVERGEAGGVAHEHPHAVARGEQARHEPAADVAGGAQHERARRRAVRARDGAQGLFAPRRGRQLGHAASVRRAAAAGDGLAPRHPAQ